MINKETYKRLTERDEFGNADIIGIDSQDLYGNLYFEEFNLLTKALNRLAELEDKIENGTLIELPCKVGDTVYCIYHFHDVEEDFEYEIIPEEVVDIIVQEDDFDIGTACRMIGKFERVCVCLTKAEAEKKLKEIKEV